MRHALPLWTTICLCGTCFCLPIEAAQKTGNKQTPAQKRDEQRENEAVRNAQNHLTDVQKDLKQAEADLREAQQAVRQAVQNRQKAATALQKTLDRLEGEHADLTGLTATRRSLKTLQTEFEEKAAPVRKTLETRADYQAAQSALTKAKAALKPADDDNGDVDRKQLAKDHLAATAKVRELEQTAFHNDPGLAALQSKVDLAEKQWHMANDKFEKAVERDGDLKAARKAFENAKIAEEKSEQAVSKEARGLASVRVKAAQATQQLQQKKLQDARDDNRNKPKNKK